ncbi:acetylglutamate kinase [Paenibacillus apiarius]|uniref:Acetylglutamate kinase n=1 Tax=Paenibacillus apiarius TaxID=46240 RepID=A0ABT4DSE2_9BACL|nr:acetylglutamate kinase [Paenibacillus apiarius]MCY9514161.1 acetylglutamate kinase [Paenibacillus apiarius]MCY9520284.1 acetylglutamate kinase [Paenibacillus apiarius]MCY9550374.1 acetylglutamate kinase [Paenibacillus apiarius]MCY9557436.1 acetylglutamate kinase [Paenibacillus apiarius]MCY9682385.1 acetylglutamate kinase [Paenibacillus apiarius]
MRTISEQARSSALAVQTKRFVMKCGGSTLAALPDSFYAQLRHLQAEGTMPVIVHGGGPAISSMLDKLGIESEFIGGLRKTNEAVLDVVEMVLAGQINKQIVRRLNGIGAAAIGLSGTDGGLIQAMPVANADEVGYVGDVTQVNAELIEGVMALQYMPIIAPIGLDSNGQRYNINADTAAGAVAAHLGVEQLLVITDVPGIMKTEQGIKTVLPVVTTSAIEAMIASGEIYGGMIPKVRAAMQCMKGGVKEVIIADGAEPNVLRRIMAGESIGTRIVQ